ncbi:MAG: hypothetical protein KIT81_08405 [Alphaproteobacteria bacterium]|nr:hypothetical protein [Alphaproteobacteria bacterium]
MLYHIDVDIDYAALGERREDILRKEWTRTAELIERGIAIGEWRKADGQGVIAVWDCESHEALNALLRDLPISPYLKSVRVLALIEHPLWPGGRLRREAKGEKDA